MWELFEYITNTNKNSYQNNNITPNLLRPLSFYFLSKNKNVPIHGTTLFVSLDFFRPGTPSRNADIRAAVFDVAVQSEGEAAFDELLKAHVTWTLEERLPFWSFKGRRWCFLKVKCFFVSFFVLVCFFQIKGDVGLWCVNGHDWYVLRLCFSHPAVGWFSTRGWA